MNDLRTAAQQALEALDHIERVAYDSMTSALARAAIAAVEGEKG